MHAVIAYCFYGGQLLLVYAPSKGTWTPPGGAIEFEESYKDAVVREVLEETNMRVLHQELIGYQDVYEDGVINRQFRVYCEVEPIGEFVADPGGDITAIKLIDPKRYAEYFDWGIIGDRIMERAQAMHRARTA